MGLNILLALTLLWFILKQKDIFVQNRLFLAVIALLFLANGTLFAVESLIELKGSSFTTRTVVFLSTVTIAMDFYTAVVFPLIFLLFPSPIFTQRKHTMIAASSLAVAYLGFPCYCRFPNRSYHVHHLRFKPHHDSSIFDSSSLVSALS